MGKMPKIVSRSVFPMVYFHVINMRRSLVLLCLFGLHSIAGFGKGPLDAGDDPVPQGKDTIPLAMSLIDSFGVGKGSNRWVPHLGPLEEWKLEVDTYSNSVPSSTIAALYSRACAKLVSVFGEKPKTVYTPEIKTYCWRDLESYPRIVTVAQFDTAGYLIVSAARNNDNDSFSFAYESGSFLDDLKKRKSIDLKSLKVMKDCHIPKGSLRDDAR